MTPISPVGTFKIKFNKDVFYPTKKLEIGQYNEIFLFSMINSDNEKVIIGKLSNESFPEKNRKRRLAE